MGKAETLSEAMAVISRGDVERFGEILLADDVIWHFGRAAAR